MLVGRAHESHGAVARRPVDGDARAHQLVTKGVDVIDFVCEVAEIARLAVIFAVPIVRELDERSLPSGRLAGLHAPLVLRRGQKDQSVSVLSGAARKTRVYRF